ncbi:hypothetical protein ACL90Y_06035 [Micrococcus luteus]
MAGQHGELQDRTRGPEDEADAAEDVAVQGNDQRSGARSQSDARAQEAAHRQDLADLAEAEAAGNESAAAVGSGVQEPGAGELDAGRDGAPRGF